MGNILARDQQLHIDVIVGYQWLIETKRRLRDPIHPIVVLVRKRTGGAAQSKHFDNDQAKPFIGQVLIIISEIRRVVSHRLIHHIFFFIIRHKWNSVHIIERQQLALIHHQNQSLLAGLRDVEVNIGQFLLSNRRARQIQVGSEADPRGKA